MSLSKASLALLALACTLSGSFAYAEIDKNELGVYWGGFYPNVGGLAIFGARFRGYGFEGAIQSQSGVASVQAGLVKEFPLQPFFSPHVSGGLSFSSGTIGLAPGVGVNFAVLPVFGMHIGFAIDCYEIVNEMSGGGWSVSPVIPLSVLVTF